MAGTLYRRKQLGDDAQKMIAENDRQAGREILDALFRNRSTPDEMSGNIVRGYLEELGSAARHEALSALEIVAYLIANHNSELTSIPWAGLRYDHVRAIRLFLAEAYEASDADAVLTVVRGLLREAWMQHVVSEAEYIRAADILPVGEEAVSKGRNAELGDRFHARIDLDLEANARRNGADRG